jgi:ATP-dependent Clp endopeptidase proteolytic subunit ClpP
MTSINSNIPNDIVSSCSGSDIINVVESQYEIHFNAGINQSSVSTLIEKLISLEEKIIKKHKNAKRKLADIEKDDDFDNFKFNIELPPIKLYITSPGGLVYQVFSLIDTIQNLRVPVHTICKGFVASAGTLLSLAGKKRYITENSYMLIHELRAGTWGKYSHMLESIENSKQLMEHIKSYYIARTKLTSAELEEQLKRDVTWNAQTCLEKGLVDEIIKSNKDKDKEKKPNETTNSSSNTSSSSNSSSNSSSSSSSS